MKTNIKLLVVSALVALGSCKQDVITLQPQPSPTPQTGDKGGLDFTKYVAIGNSLTAGFQAGALFTEGQQNSFPLILSGQFSIAQGTTLVFNQPDINSVNGYNSTYSSPPTVVLGRLVLYAADGVQAHALPTPAGYPGVPAPYNTADLPGAYAGDKTQLNNFGVPGILLGQCLDNRLGNPTQGKYYNPLYARFASNPGTSTILGDAIATQPTFFTFDLGNNDVLGYATTGGDTGSGGARIPLTPSANFQAYYQTAIGGLLGNTSAKGVVTTIPDVTSIPFFLTVKWNAIPLDAATAAYAQTNLANNYNAFLAGMKGAGVITAAEVTKRTIAFNAGQNPILITDETLTDLKPYMAAYPASFQILAKARQTTSVDLVPLTAATKLGTLANATDPTTVYGVAVPMSDKYILIKEEVDSIKASTASFNAIINAVAASNSSRIAVADVNAALNNFLVQYATLGGIFQDNVLITPSFVPPFGAFSEDGVHPNSRGYAYIANIIIDAINAKTSWGATIPKASLGDHKGTLLPLIP